LLIYKILVFFRIANILSPKAPENIENIIQRKETEHEPAK